MDILGAINDHTNWVRQFDELLNGTLANPIDADVVTRDDQCELGQWLRTEGKEQHGTEEIFGRLHNDHSQFHLTAGKILKAYNKQNIEEGRRLHSDLLKIQLQDMRRILLDWHKSGYLEQPAIPVIEEEGGPSAMERVMQSAKDVLLTDVIPKRSKEDQ